MTDELCENIKSPINLSHLIFFLEGKKHRFTIIMNSNLYVYGVCPSHFSLCF